ncbi:MAG: hypothetical protein Q9190_001651 [Brigantiaea leucoxantha]
MQLRNSRWTPLPRKRAFSTDHLPSGHHFTPLEITSALANPATLSSIQHIIIGPIHRYLSPKNHPIHQTASPWSPLPTLRALEELPNIVSITIDLFHILNAHSTTDIDLTSCNLIDPLETLKLSHLEPPFAPSLCAWPIPTLPKSLIIHFPTHAALNAAHPYRGSLKAWKCFVSSHRNVPEYLAFDYTADFHSRDLSGPEKGGVDYGEDKFEEFLPLGDGYLYPFGCNNMEFVMDMEKNMLYFAKYPERWKEDLYERIRDKGGVVSSSLDCETDHEVAEAVVDGI